MEVRPGYKQTEVGVIPEDWDIRGLLDVARIANGQVDPKNEPFRSMVLVAPDHIESGSGRLLEKRTAAEQQAISGKYLFHLGDVVYSKIRPYLRKAILADFAGLCSADMYPLTPTEAMLGGYLLPMLLAHRFSKYAESVSIRSGMPKINRAELADFSLPVPDISEQRAIATALSDMDALLDGLDRLITKKHAIKQAAMQQLLTGQTRLPGFSGEWEVKRLGDHLNFLKNGVNARAELSSAGDIRYLHYGDIHGSQHLLLDPAKTAMPYLPSAKAKRLDRLRDGDLIFADASEDLDGVGKSVEIQNAEGVELVSGLHTMAVRLDKAVLADGFKAYIQFIPSFRSHLRQLTSGTKVYATNRAHIVGAELKLPGTDEQKAIALLLSDMEAEITALETRRNKTRALKQAIMQELLTGRTRLV
ncbi:restriction endonuclease subunit S [Nitrosospira sp. NRS527]|uniref:restriction endonuclease subunit S n=1 Tax=Nitrosospira sp. NRS527 TaxID=155925 RepID=UPI001AF8BD3F|nr:restriction endonuclease subunit S [Nitrosospira sp. NRS527]BCT67017.1 hypothetical protein NNRS527_00593 [Nitrosospira sp. NRS527]